MRRSILVPTVVALSLIIGACSELKDEKSPTEGNATLHGVGFANAASENSHAKFLQKNGWNTQTCQSCHGFAYDGGTAKQSCLTCHNKPDGPENCSTCHSTGNEAQWKDLYGNSDRSIRGVGAHQKHVVAGNLGAVVSCSTCHSVPARMSSAGHIDGTAHAEIRVDTNSVFYRANTVYAPGNVSCTNTYCHGNFNGGNLNVTMSWTETSATAAQCGTCHGDVTKTTLKEKAFPKTGHTPATVTSDCSTCHGAVVNSSLTIIDPSKHINGRLN